MEAERSLPVGGRDPLEDELPTSAPDADPDSSSLAARSDLCMHRAG